MHEFITIRRAMIVPSGLQQLLTVLALALALLAIPAFSPDEAGAREISEQQARQTCQQIGGRFEVEVMDPDVPSTSSFTCTQLLWDLYTCSWSGIEPYLMDCSRI